MEASHKMTMLYFMTYVSLVTIIFASLFVSLVFQMYEQIDTQRQNGEMFVYLRDKLQLISDAKLSDLMGRILDTDLDDLFQDDATGAIRSVVTFNKPDTKTKPLLGTGAEDVVINLDGKQDDAAGPVTAVTFVNPLLDTPSTPLSKSSSGTGSGSGNTSSLEVVSHDPEMVEMKDMAPSEAEQDHQDNQDIQDNQLEHAEPPISPKSMNAMKPHKNKVPHGASGEATSSPIHNTTTSSDTTWFKGQLMPKKEQPEGPSKTVSYTVSLENAAITEKFDHSEVQVLSTQIEDVKHARRRSWVAVFGLWLLCFLVFGFVFSKWRNGVNDVVEDAYGAAWSLCACLLVRPCPTAYSVLRIYVRFTSHFPQTLLFCFRVPEPQFTVCTAVDSLLPASLPVTMYILENDLWCTRGFRSSAAVNIGSPCVTELQ